MDAVDAALLNAVGALLLPEAGGVGGEGLGQAVFRDDLVDELADHGVLGGADEVQVLALDLVHHGVHLSLGHDALHHVAVDHKGRDAEDEALADHKVPGVGQYALMDAGDVPHEIVKAVAGHTACGVHVDAVEGLHDLGVVGDLKVGDHRLTKALDLHVAAVIGADGHGGIDDVGDLEHDLADLLGQLALLGLQLREAVGVGLYLGLGRLGLRQLGGVLLGLTHEHTHLLAQGVAGRAELLGLGHDGAVLAVQGDDLVHQRQLLLLELLFDVLLDNFGVLPDEFDVQHSGTLL